MEMNNVQQNNGQHQVQQQQQQQSSHKKRFNIENKIMALIFFTLSIFLIFYGIVQISTANAKDNIRARHMWAYTVNGIFSLLVGFHGFFLLFHKRGSAKCHVYMNILYIAQAFILFIIYSALVNRYIKEDCGGSDFWSNPYCHHEYKVYIGISLAIFWVINIIVIPFSLLCSIIHMRSFNNNNGVENA